jgi:MscS family membrane protein
MSRYFFAVCFTLLLFPGRSYSAAATKTASDPLDRTNPRSTVTAFLEACHGNDFIRASQYLDLRELPEASRAQQGPRLARQLQAILNSASQFNVLQLSQNSEGNLADDTNPTLEHVVSISRNGESFPIELERVELTPGLPIWLFSSATVSEIPALTPVSTQSALEARLPRFLVRINYMETPIWKWIALLALAGVVLIVFRIMAAVLSYLAKNFASRFGISPRWLWIEAVLQPWFILLSAIIFRIAEQFIDPSALSRLYIGRAILLVVVFSFAWCFIILVDLFLTRLDSLLDPRQRAVSHSLIYIGRRAAKFSIFALAAIIVLDNWGYNMSTMIAGLGVGGIAIALAAQGTIANVFGGVSVIGDHPVMVGDYGNFGGILGTVEDIGMRSTRVRTLNRTVMSIPNSAFAGMNLENYELRDKILFNPTLQLKRGVAKEKIRHCMGAIEQLLKNDTRMEVGTSPLRLTSLTAASFGLEIFAYARTSDINEFYKIEADLFLEIDDALTSAGVELA